VENIQLDMAVIHIAPPPSDTPKTVDKAESHTSKPQSFSKVLSNESSSEHSTEEKGDDEHSPVASGKSSPKEDDKRPKENMKKDEGATVLTQDILIAIEPIEISPVAENINHAITMPMQDQNSKNDLIIPDTPIHDNVVPLVQNPEIMEGNPTLITSAPADIKAPPSTDIEAESIPVDPATPIIATDLQQITNPGQVKNTEGKTSKEALKNTVTDKLSLVKSPSQNTHLADIEDFSEDSTPDLLFKEAPKSEMPIQTPIVRSLIKEFADIQSNGISDSTIGNETGIKLGDIQSSPLRPSVQMINNTQTTPLPALNLDRPGWEQSFANNVSWMNSENIQTANIKISPAELGPIEIKMSIKQDQLTLNINAHHAVTRETLENALPRLKEILTGNNYNSVNVDVSGQQSGSGNTESQTQRHSEWITSSEDPELEATRENTELIYPQQRMSITGNGMVDIFA
jgi:flagellar hook-length control protein FliK